MPLTVGFLISFGKCPYSNRKLSVLRGVTVKTICNQFLHSMALQNEFVFFHRAFGFKQAVILIAHRFNALRAALC